MKCAGLLLMLCLGVYGTGYAAVRSCQVIPLLHGPGGRTHVGNVAASGPFFAFCDLVFRPARRVENKVRCWLES